MCSPHTTWKVRSKLFVCRCNEQDPIYFCGSCSLRVPEQDVLSHVTSLSHKEMHQVVVEVNKEMYSNISNQIFNSVHMLNLLLHQTSERELLPPSTRFPVKAPAAFKKHVTFVMENNKVIRIHPKDYGTARPKPVCEKPIRPILKRPSAAPVCFTTAEKPTTSSTLTRTFLSAFSSKSAVQSAVVSRPLGRSQTVPAGKTFTAAGSTSASKVARNSAPCSKMKNVPTCAKVTPKALVTPWIKTTSVATVKPQLEQKNAGASKLPHAKRLLGENAAVSFNLGINRPSAPHLPTAMPEEKMPRKEPSHKSANKTAPTGKISKVGLDQLIIVTWEGKQQVYCLLCAARLRSSSHATSYNHCYNYVKMKYPGLTAKPSEMENKLNSIVAHLAEVERDVGFQSPQRLTVTKEMYQQLAALAEDTAVEMVKMMRRKDPQVSSVKDETVEAFRGEAASPCPVSSSDDGGSVVDKVSGVISDQTQQEHKLHQTQQIHLPGEVISSEVFPDRCSTADKSEERVHESVCDQAYPDPVSGSQAKEIKDEILENVQEDKTDAEDDSMSEITDENSGTKDLKALCKTENPHSPDMTAPPLLQEAVKSPLKPSPVQIWSPPLQTPASAAAGPQDSSGLSCSPEQDAGLGEYSTSHAQPLKFFGAKAQGCSHLLLSLNVSQSSKSVIGMDSVWECRGIPQELFYLCESCEDMLSYQDIFQHMVSLQHQLKYLWRSHPEFLQMFWLKEDLPPELKTEILNLIVQQLALRERFHKVDAQCALLGQELFWFVRMTHFSEALKVVKIITNQENCKALSLRVNALLQKGQQNNYLRIEKPLSTKSLLASTMNTEYRGDFETGQNGTKTELKSVVEDPYIVRKRGDLSPDGSSLSVKNEPCASPIPVHPNPHKTSQGSSRQPTLAPNQSCLPQVKLSASPPTVSLMKESPGIRKRAAETPLESLLLCPISPLKHPLPAKCAPSPLTVKSEPRPPSASVYSETSTPPTMDRTWCSEMIPEVNTDPKMGFSFPSASAPSTSSSSRAALSPGNIKTRWDSRSVVIKPPTSVLKKWDSKCQLVKVTVKKNLPVNVVEEIKMEDISGRYSAAASIQSASTAATADPRDPHTPQSSHAQDGVGNGLPGQQ